MTSRSQTAVSFAWRLVVSAIATAVVTIALAGALSGASKSLANRVDTNTARILQIIDTNVQGRNNSNDAIFCIISSADFTRAGVDACLAANDVPLTYITP